MTRVFLCGPVCKPEDDGQEWRNSIKVNHEEPFTWIDPTEEIPRSVAKMIDAETLVKYDKTVINFCDALLVAFTDEEGFGTWREVEYAVETRDIPVVFWDQLDQMGTDPNDVSPWVKEAGPLFADLDDCVSYLERELILQPSMKLTIPAPDIVESAREASESIEVVRDGAGVTDDLKSRERLVRGDADDVDYVVDL